MEKKIKRYTNDLDIESYRTNTGKGTTSREIAIMLGITYANKKNPSKNNPNTRIINKIVDEFRLLFGNIETESTVILTESNGGHGYHGSEKYLFNDEQIEIIKKLLVGMDVADKNGVFRFGGISFRKTKNIMIDRE